MLSWAAFGDLLVPFECLLGPHGRFLKLFFSVLGAFLGLFWAAFGSRVFRAWAIFELFLGFYVQLHDGVGRKCSKKAPRNNAQHHPRDQNSSQNTVPDNKCYVYFYIFCLEPSSPSPCGAFFRHLSSPKSIGGPGHSFFMYMYMYYLLRPDSLPSTVGTSLQIPQLLSWIPHAIHKAFSTYSYTS